MGRVSIVSISWEGALYRCSRWTERAESGWRPVDASKQQTRADLPVSVSRHHR